MHICQIFILKQLKGYCTIFQHALKSLEITGVVLFERKSKKCKEKFCRIKKIIRNLKFSSAENMQGLL